MKKQIEQLTNQELLKYYANAKATYMGCGGHGKASVNRGGMLNYSKALCDRGILLDDWDIDMPEGVFNGEGSF